MSYRFIRVIVFFDLPTITGENKRNYRAFHKFLTKNGFVMVQESVYSKLALNTTVSSAIIDNIRRNVPPEGLVQMMVVTEKQYNRMEYLVGEASNRLLDSDERLVIL